ncbi:hypothetical protein PN36_04400 [Candidatus Thiomargarita nelsonii]|uniref:Uncharacterized protein n=1 Tax=Candidatus Thiomargarita nelsonii TaxID=1003181 RepID=A0A0A6P7P0_9GAMM|nr:hypothetical protein PN36_04400 [Candidatus Thiomargarita nelsonii]
MKRLIQVVAALDEEKEKKQAQIHKEVLDHLTFLKNSKLALIFFKPPFAFHAPKYILLFLALECHWLWRVL